MTQRPQREPREAVPASAERANDSPKGTTDASVLAADVGRAQQRLAQEATHDSTAIPATPEQAQALAGRVTQAIAGDPKGALRAAGSANESLFEAAMARPTD